MSAKLVFEVRKSKKKLDKPVSKKIRAAENDLKRAHKLWKRSGKPVDKSDRLWQRYAKARSYLQIVSRHEDNKTNIKLNNTLIYATAHDKNKVYSMLRSLRNEPTKKSTDILETPVGKFYGKDVLEGFAAGAEYLGRPTDNNNNFDIKLYSIVII